MDNELTLFDRIEIIKTTDNKYDLEHNAYLSFSGGKDSTVLHYLLDLALPNNRIPRVFINTGIEYNEIVKFVLEMAKNDDRFVILKPTKPIKQVLETYGYPFKSKGHSMRVYQFNRGANGNDIKKYITGYEHNGKKSIFVCPKTLLYQFEEKGKYNYSHLCCQKLKKEPAHDWAKENHRTILITGMRKEEGGSRKAISSCILTDEKGRLQKFHPLLVVDDQFEDWFIERERVILCNLYYPPYNFVRTGCKGCPFSLNLKTDLETMSMFLPNERKQCEMIWKPVYEEYRRIGYRLDKETGQLNLFDFIKGE